MLKFRIETGELTRALESVTGCSVYQKESEEENLFENEFFIQDHPTFL